MSPLRARTARHPSHKSQVNFEDLPEGQRHHSSSGSRGVIRIFLRCYALYAGTLLTSFTLTVFACSEHFLCAPRLIYPGGFKIRELDLLSRGDQGGSGPCSLAGTYILRCGASEQPSAKGGVDVGIVD